VTFSHLSDLSAYFILPQTLTLVLCFYFSDYLLYLRYFIINNFTIIIWLTTYCFSARNLGLPNTERVVLPSVDGWWDYCWGCLSIHALVQRSSQRIYVREREKDRKRTSWLTIDHDRTRTSKLQIIIISLWLYKNIKEAISIWDSLDPSMLEYKEAACVYVSLVRFPPGRFWTNGRLSSASRLMAVLCVGRVIGSQPLVINISGCQI